MDKNQNYLKKQFYNYSFVLLLSLTVIFIFATLVLYREQYNKNLEVQAQLSANVQSQIDSSLMEMDKLINGLLFNKSFVKVMKNTNYSAEYIDYNNQVMEYFISLDAPLFSTYRVIAFNDNAYYTLTKTGESSDYIKDACRNYPWKEELLHADGKKIILPLHPDSFDSSGEQVYSVARAVTDGKANFGFIEVQNLYENLYSDSHFRFCCIVFPSGRNTLSRRPDSGAGIPLPEYFSGYSKNRTFIRFPASGRPADFLWNLRLLRLGHYCILSRSFLYSLWNGSASSDICNLFPDGHPVSFYGARHRQTHGGSPHGTESGHQ